MNELTPDKPVKISRKGAATEARALKSILGVVNTPEFSVDDGNGPFRPPEMVADPIPTQAAQREASPADDEALPVPVGLHYNGPVEVARQLPARVFITGRLKSGKDYVLSAFGYNIHGFAEPLYALQKYFFGSDDKSLPGARKFLQTVGQYGRGQVDAQYPLTAARAAFVAVVRGLGEAGHFPKALRVEWKKFGLSPDLWLNALIARVQDLPESVRAGVSNVRFQNEYEGLSAAGWTHFHVMCSPQTWAKRLAEVGLRPDSPEVKDFSEKFAAGMDADSLQRVKLKPQGPKLRVIWNDPAVKPPSPRFYTPEELQ